MMKQHFSPSEESELASLRVEITRLRKEIAQTATPPDRLAAATQALDSAERELARILQVSPASLQTLEAEARSVQCINNLKLIGVAARGWAGDHKNVFPPDFM